VHVVFGVSDVDESARARGRQPDEGIPFGICTAFDESELLREAAEGGTGKVACKRFQACRAHDPEVDPRRPHRPKHLTGTVREHRRPSSHFPVPLIDRPVRFCVGDPEPDKPGPERQAKPLVKAGTIEGRQSATLEHDAGGGTGPLGVIDQRPVPVKGHRQRAMEDHCQTMHH